MTHTADADADAGPVVLATAPLPPVVERMLGEAGLTARVADRRAGRLATALAAAAPGGVDVLISHLTDEVDADVLSTLAPRLRAVCTLAVGHSNIDVERASRDGVVVANTPEVLTDSTADLAIALMLAVCRRVPAGDRLVREGRFTGWRPDMLLGRDVWGSTLGIVGFGRIGRAVARRAAGFQMRVIASARGLQGHEVCDGVRVEFLPHERLLEEADIVSLHCPLTEETHHLIDAGALARMKRTAVLVNTARGPVVDERALVEALSSRQIFGAGLDVYEHEPDVVEGLLALDNTVLLPHVGSATADTRAAMAALCAENAIAAARGVIPPHCVNPGAWEARDAVR